MVAKIVARGDAVEPAYLNNLKVAASGWGVVSGMAVSEKGAGANMSVDVAAGTVWIDDTEVTKGSTTNVAITAAHATYARYDLVIINSSGTISVVDGTAGDPSFANDYDFEGNNAILLAEVEVPATDTAIEDAQITDKRIITQETRIPSDVTGSRAVDDTVYQNTTGQAMLVVIGGHNNDSGFGTLHVNELHISSDNFVASDITVCKVSAAVDGEGAADDLPVTLVGVVPNGWYYKADETATSDFTLESWVETPI
jgi:hypothetical protein